MQEDPRRYRAGARQHAFEVIQAQGDAHGKHDQHQQRTDVRADAGKGRRGVVGRNGEQHGP
ncbi:hypothetical protein D3C80_1289610 [compost metagenome]